MELSTKIFKALSDETRLRILNVLLVRECCVCEVMSALNISQTRASRNLNCLYNVGFLTMAKEGRWSLYSANTRNASPLISRLLQSVKETLKDSPEACADLKNLRGIQRVITSNSCCAKKEQPSTDQPILILNETV